MSRCLLPAGAMYVGFEGAMFCYRSNVFFLLFFFLLQSITDKTTRVPETSRQMHPSVKNKAGASARSVECPPVICKSVAHINK